MLEIVGEVESIVWFRSEIEVLLELFVALDQTRKSYVPVPSPVRVALGVEALGDVSLTVVAALHCCAGVLY
jgi:hypothetical protein